MFNLPGGHPPPHDRSAGVHGVWVNGVRIVGRDGARAENTGFRAGYCASLPLNRFKYIMLNVPAKLDARELEIALKDSRIGA